MGIGVQISVLMWFFRRQEFKPSADLQVLQPAVTVLCRPSLTLLVLVAAYCSLQ